MKITYANATGRLGFNDLGSQIKQVSYQQRNIGLSVGESMYLAETGDVLLSAQFGDIKKFAAAGKITLNDEMVLGAGGPVVLTHNFNFLPNVTLTKKTVVGPLVTWVVTAPTSVTTNAAMTETTVVIAAAGTYQIRVS
jgi:hypothetical protein